jgi:hypothetical protein
MPCSSERRQHRAHGALIEAACELDIGCGSESLGIDEAVIGGIRLVEGREAVGVVFPGEATAVDDGAAHRGAMAAQKFRQRMHRNVGAVVERLQQDRGCHRVVDDQRHAVAVRDLRQRLDIADIAGGIADGLGEHRLGVLVDQPLDRIGLVAVGKASFDTLARQHVTEQRMRGAVELGHGHDVAAIIGGIDERKMQRGLTGCDRKRADAAFELGNALFKNSSGRIGNPAVAKAFALEIEQRGAVIGAVERIGDGLVDRDGDGLGGGIGFVARVNSDRLVAHRRPPRPAQHTVFPVLLRCRPD